MQVPFFPPIARNDISSVFALALHEVGITEEDFIRLLDPADGLKYREGKSLSDIRDVSQVIKACFLLQLPVDTITVGYMRRNHLRRVVRAIRNGTYLLPITPQLIQRLEPIDRLNELGIDAI